MILLLEITREELEMVGLLRSPILLLPTRVDPPLYTLLFVPFNDRLPKPPTTEMTIINTKHDIKTNVQYLVERFVQLSSCTNYLGLMNSNLVTVDCAKLVVVAEKKNPIKLQ